LVLGFDPAQAEFSIVKITGSWRAWVQISALEMACLVGFEPRRIFK
jgi:hypothetical protein